MLKIVRLVDKKCIVILNSCSDYTSFSLDLNFLIKEGKI